MNDDIYVDKTGLIEYTNNRIGKRNRYVCVSRSRRFGKSMAAEMLAAYYGKECDSSKLFENYKIVKAESYLRNLLKDKTYVALAYMTGILPVKKYGTHSALNMFDEYSMTDPGVYAEFIGFTQNEVEDLCNQYHVDFEKEKEWYNGIRKV